MKELLILIKSTVDRYVKKQSFVAEVLEVDRSDDTCLVKPEDGPELYGVRLKSVVDELQHKVVIYPKIGSLVMCSLVENNPNEAYISKYGEIEEVVLDVKKVTINGGELGGMVKAKELEEQLNKHKAILEAILQVMNGAPLTQPGGAPSVLQTALKTALTGKQTGDFSNLQNEQLLH